MTKQTQLSANVRESTGEDPRGEVVEYLPPKSGDVLCGCLIPNGVTMTIVWEQVSPGVMQPHHEKCGGLILTIRGPVSWDEI